MASLFKNYSLPLLALALWASYAYLNHQEKALEHELWALQHEDPLLRGIDHFQTTSEDLLLASYTQKLKSSILHTEPGRWIDSELWISELQSLESKGLTALHQSGIQIEEGFSYPLHVLSKQPQSYDTHKRSRLACLAEACKLTLNALSKSGAQAIQTLNAKPSTSAQIQVIELSFRGNTQSLRSFLNQLENSPFCATIDVLQVSPCPEHYPLSNFTLHIHHHYCAEPTS
jgi:hypothetical protein